MSRAIHLKIKIKTLAIEAQYIRKEERKALSAGRKGAALLRDDYKRHYQSYESLRMHRIGIVRSVARTNHLAYGFLRGHAYVDMEARCRPDNKPNFSAIEKVAKRFGTSVATRWDKWVRAAKSHLKNQPVKAAA